MTDQLPRTPGGSGPMTGGMEPETPGTGIFDAHHPPSDERIADCVHCGFCLPTCPTYTLWGEEMDSPRGRIYLMKMGKEGSVPMDDTYVGHLDACLGCMACVSACPSGVRYDELIEAVRPQIERNFKRPIAARAFRGMIFSLFPYPSRLRPAAVLGTAYQRLGGRVFLRKTGILRRLPKQLQAMEQLLPPISIGKAFRRLPAVTPAQGERRRRVGMLTGCVQRVFYSDVNEATVRVLAADGCEVVAPTEQRCCGALSIHAGREPEALVRARRLIEVFERADVDTIVVNVAGCGSSMKEYGHLLRDDPEWAERAAAFAAKVRDISEVLDEVQPVAERHPIQARLAYHDACHLAHAQGVRAQPRAVLRAVPGLEVVDIPEADICCGSAGIYNLVQPEAAEDLGRRKAENVMSIRPDAVVTANPGCLLQIRRYLAAGPGGMPVPLLHPVQVVDASIRGVDPFADSGGGRKRRISRTERSEATGTTPDSHVPVEATASHSAGPPRPASRPPTGQHP